MFVQRVYYVQSAVVGEGRRSAVVRSSVFNLGLELARNPLSSVSKSSGREVQRVASKDIADSYKGLNVGSSIYSSVNRNKYTVNPYN